MAKFDEKIAESTRKALLDPRFTSRNQLSSGRIFFVLKTAATNYTQFKEDHPDYKAADGVTTIAAVYNTVDAAVGACTADQGDVIYVMPGHTETITSSSTTLDIAGVTIICLGNGTNAPHFTFSTAAATINVSAADVKWQGGYFLANYLDVASTFTLAAAKDFTLDGAMLKHSSNVLNFLSVVTTGTTDYATDGLTVTDNKYYGLNTTPLAFISVLGDVDRLTVTGNYVNSASTADVGHFITFAAKDATNAIISDNTLIVVGATNATVGIFLTGSGTAMTGIVSNNRIASLDTTTEIIATAGTGLKYFDNLYTGVADKSGYVLPAIDSAA